MIKYNNYCITSEIKQSDLNQFVPKASNKTHMQQAAIKHDSQKYIFPPS